MNPSIIKKILQVLKYLAIYYLSIKMIAFAIPKLLHMQFRILHYESFMPLAQISKYQHMWSFFGRSYHYNIFIGLIEIMIGILVVFRKTRLIALLLSIGVCSNVLILNIEFEVFFALQHIILDLAITILLLIEYRKDLYHFFLKMGGKIRQSPNTIRNKFLKILPLIYVLLFPVGYFIYVYNLKTSIENPINGSYRISDLRINNSEQNINQGKLGADPMLFFEYNGQTALSVNDSLYLGSYSVKKDSVFMYFKAENKRGHKLFKGEIINDNILQGKVNDSLELKLKIERLTEEEDYLNDLYK